MRTEHRRLGRFRVLREFIDDALGGRGAEHIATLNAVFAKVIIIEAKQCFDLDSIEYLAFCPDFAPVPPYTESPLYDADVMRLENFVGGTRVVTFDVRFERARF